MTIAEKNFLLMIENAEEKEKRQIAEMLPTKILREELNKRELKSTDKLNEVFECLKNTKQEMSLEEMKETIGNLRSILK